MPSKRAVLASYGLTVLRTMAVLVLFATIFVIVFLPAATSGLTSGEGGAGVGCLAAAVGCGMTLTWLVRSRPNLPAPAFAALDQVCRQLAAVFLIFAPAGPATELFANRGTAVAVAVPVGVALWLGCLWGFRRYVELPTKRGDEQE